MAGPCSAESEEQLLETARALTACPNVSVFRAGLWKPRTRPGIFEGVGEAGLPWMRRVREETSLLTTTEVANARHVELCLEDGMSVLWIGARTTANPFQVQDIADALRGVDIPVLVKNPIVAEIGLWIGAIERLDAAGLRRIAAVHRGFATWKDSAYRYEPKWRIPIELQRMLPDLPILCDPSHIAGTRELVPQIARMALDLGIGGLMVESHIDPDSALSDAHQQITPAELSVMLTSLQTRSPEITDPDAAERIEVLRRRITEADAAVLAALAERKRWVGEIGSIKKEHEIAVLQMDRWKQLLSDQTAEAERLGLSTEFVKALFEIMHAQAVKEQL